MTLGGCTRAHFSHFSADINRREIMAADIIDVPGDNEK